MVSMGTVWDRATEFLSDNLAAIFPLALVAIFVPFSIWNSIAPLAATLAESEKWALYGVILFLVVCTVWGGLAITALAIDPSAGRRPATQIAARQLPWAIGLSILLLAALLLLAIPIPVALALGGYDFAALANGGKPALPQGGATAFVLLYFLLLIVAIIWLGARLALINPILVMEERGFGSFARSFKLTRPIIWKLIGVIILYSIVSQVAEMAANLVFGSIFRLILGGDGQVTAATVLTAILVSMIETGFSVLAAAFTAKLYLAVRDARGAIVESA